MCFDQGDPQVISLPDAYSRGVLHILEDPYVTGYGRPYAVFDTTERDEGDRMSIEAAVTGINAYGTVSLRWTATLTRITMAEYWPILIERRATAAP